MDFKLNVLTSEDIKKIDSSSREILSEIGVKVPDDRIKSLLHDAGAKIDGDIVKFNENYIDKYLNFDYKGHTLYGRDISKKAVFEKGFSNFQSSSGQFALIDLVKRIRKEPNTADLIDAVRLAEGLENIDIAGAFVMPSDMHPQQRSVESTYHLLKNTLKPITLWIDNEQSAKKIIEIMKIVRGGSGKLAQYPLTYILLETISPLAYTKESLGIMWQFAKNNLPLGFAPMAMTCGTAPATLAATLTLENAEILSGVLIARAINSDVPMAYWGLPHVMDMRNASISFGSPEQTLMALAVIQLADYYNLPVGTNTGLSDAIYPDSQSGAERALSAYSAMMAGCNIFGHQGICGSDQGASLEQLYIDNETIGYIKRIKRGFEVSDETLLIEDIKEKGIGGNFLTSDSTLKNYRKELWMPSIFFRGSFESYKSREHDMAKEAAVGARKKIDEFVEEKYEFSVQMDKEIQDIINS